jgi:hypothetical protein
LETTKREDLNQAPEERWSFRRESAGRAALLALENYFRVLGEEQSQAGEWVDQKASPLGREKHLALVRGGVLQASRVGRRVLVRRQGHVLSGPSGVTTTSVLKDMGLEQIDA